MKAETDSLLQTFAAELDADSDVSAPAAPSRGVVQDIGQDGMLLVRTSSGSLFWCEVLLTGTLSLEMYAIETRVLVLPPEAGGTGLCMGPIGRLTPPTRLSIRAGESLTLRCGDASIDLRADGKVLIKGDDVTVRAKGTKRIRAGTVSIN